MTEGRNDSEFVWEKGWDAHENAQLLRMAGLSFFEKLKWLDEAQELIRNIEDYRPAPRDTEDSAPVD